MLEQKEKTHREALLAAEKRASDAETSNKLYGQEIKDLNLQYQDMKNIIERRKHELSERDQKYLIEIGLMKT